MIGEVELYRLRENPENPRDISEEKFGLLVKSVLVFPRMLWLSPIVYDETGVVLGGNMRLRALNAIADMDDAEREDIIKQDKRLGDGQVSALVAYWQAWASEKAPRVPAVCADDLTEEQKREFIIKHNASFGKWDFDRLGNEWSGLPLNDWAIDVWQPMEIEADNKDSDKSSVFIEDDNFNEESAGIKARCSYGDIWELGEHRLMCGDSTDAASVALLMDGQKADMVFTDPPYGMKKEIEGVMNDNLNREDLGKFNNLWIPISFSNLKDNGSWYCWGRDEILMDIYADILRPMIYARKLSFRNLITWDKGNAQGQTSDGLKLYPIADEKCLFVVRGAATLSSGVFRTKEYFFEGFSGIRDYLRGELEKSGLSMKEVIGMTSTYASHYFSSSQWAFPTEKDYNTIREHCRGAAFQKEYAAFQKEYAELQKEYAELQKEYAAFQKEYAELLPYFDNTHDNMNNVWHYERARYTDNDSKTNDLHATPKPIQLCARAIKSSSREGESVLDLFGGSGSTLVACEQVSRKCYMMELAPHYCDVIITRWEEYTGKEAVKIM